MRSLVKASSLSFAGSSLANSGMLRRMLTSSSSDMVFAPFPSASGRRHQLREQRARPFEVVGGDIFRKLAFGEDQNTIEPLGERRVLQRPDQRAALALLEHGIH